MKKISQIVLLLFSCSVLACVCNENKITEKYIESDFVAKIKIKKNYKNENSEELYKTDFIINELFKGEKIKALYVAGRSDQNAGSSCSLFIPVNTELIVYARKNKDGKYIIGMCSGLLYLDKTNLKKQKRELEILKTFKSKKITFTEKINYREKNYSESKNIGTDLEQFRGIEPNKEYGIYEITFDANLRIKNVSDISGFGNQIDQKLIEIIKKSKWSSNDNGIKDKIPDNSKLLIGIYFYGKEKNNMSFLSTYYL
ncbi:hypothetical protein SOM12_18480 [Flavobacterium sp. CFBP9031]|uniref:hypothetical protein n=1 Tax=Flavobacterium sp. CFBP9031 TaxID=3096538 RepID=UPI002A69AAC3|nr:hypothetical protein [Flavobacterium sp. CFBP9031]MDY0989424.1 hypothetical protein [Flavobacterium sp. CFBP9031]